MMVPQMQPAFLKKTWLSVLVVLFLGWAFLGLGPKQPFHYEYNLPTGQLKAGEGFPIEFRFYIPNKYFLYRDKIDVEILEPLSFFILSKERSPSEKKEDKFFKKILDIYHNEASLVATVIPPAEVNELETLKMRVIYQGCSENLCYPVVREEIELSLHFQTTEASSGSARVGPRTAFNIKEMGLLVALLAVFLAGIATAFTPCVLPLIPIILTYIGAQDRSRPFMHHFQVIVLMLSMALSYALLGYFAATFGWTLGFLFQNVYFLITIALLFVVLALSLFGVYQIQMPYRLRQWMSRLGGKGITGAVLSGFTMGFLAAPCVGPIIAGLLIYVAQSGNPLYGFGLLFIFGVGMGMPFLLMNIFYDTLSKRLKAKKWTLVLERVMGVMLLLPALYYGYIATQHFMPPATGIYLQKNVFWTEDPKVAFSKAKHENKPILVDFYASWCLPCIELEKVVFSHERVQERLKGFVALRVDCTEETPVCKEMVDRFHVVGWPTILFLSPDGKVNDQFSLIGESLNVEEMLEHIDKFSKGRKYE
jgi:thioredoxin:protein disulfide reductase